MSQLKPLIDHLLVRGFLLLVLSFSCSALAYEGNFDLRVTDETVQKVEELLKRNKVSTQPVDPDEMEKLFRARSSSHIVRLTQVYLDTVKDPDFTKEFPEFKELVKNEKKTVEGLLNHDFAKHNESTKNAIRVLSMLQGYDYRNPNKDLPPDVDKKIRAVLKDAIDDINKVDKKVMAEKLKAISPDPSWAAKHEALTDTLDLYDTYKSRQEELAKGGRKLSSPSEWIEKLEAEGAYSPEQLEGNPLRKRLAKYLEAKDPLANAGAYAKADDFMAKAGGDQFASKIESKFQVEKKLLLARAALLDGGRIAVEQTGRAASSGVTRVAFAAAKYIYDPNANTPEKLLEDFFAVSGTFTCASPGCNEFLKSCADRIGYDGPLSSDELLKQAGAGACLKEFFSRPLEEQIQLRQDRDLDQLLSNYAPAIRNLKCEKKENSTVVSLELPKKSGEIQSQKITFDGNGKPQQISRKDSADDRIFIGESGFQFVQHCRDVSDCKTYGMKQIRSERLHFFKEEAPIGQEKNFPFKVPVDTFRWAKANESLMKVESRQILDCCQRESCQNFFSTRSQDFQIHQARGGVK